MTSIRIADASECDRLTAFYRSRGYLAETSAADTFYVAEHSDRVVGLVRRTLEHSTTMLRGMQIDPEFQRRGIGTRLLDLLVSDLGAAECFCVPFAHLVSFYGQAGFQLLSEQSAPSFLVERVGRYRSEGQNVLIMRRRQSRWTRSVNG